MKITLFKFSVFIEKTPDDMRFNNESHFLYHVKKCLIKMGYDVIKKRMAKDGHLVCDYQQYIRSRKLTNDKSGIAIYSGHYAIYDAGHEFNKDGNITLQLERGFC